MTAFPTDSAPPQSPVGGAERGQPEPPSTAARIAPEVPSSPVQQRLRGTHTSAPSPLPGGDDAAREEGPGAVLRPGARTSPAPGPAAGAREQDAAPAAGTIRMTRRGGKPRRVTNGNGRARRGPLEPSEAGFQKSVTELADALRIWWYHAYQPEHDKAGFPDLMLVGGRGTIFRELKRTGEDPTPAQLDVGMRLRRSGQDWDVWRPEDMRSSRVLAEMQAIR